MLKFFIRHQTSCYKLLNELRHNHESVEFFVRNKSIDTLVKLHDQNNETISF